MKYIEGRGLHFTVFYCYYKGLVQAGWVLGKVFTTYELTFGDLHLLHFFLQAFTKASKLAVTTGQNRAKGHQKTLNHLRFKTFCLFNLTLTF